ncbi:hypothetical protein DSUL_20223 [Desulfovibrionales bacterium]
MTKAVSVTTHKKNEESNSIYKKTYC